MAQIFEFPAKAIRDWRLMEESIRPILERGGADATAVDAIVGRMKSFFDLCNREFNTTYSYQLPSSATPAQRDSVKASIEGLNSQFSTWIHQFTSELFVDRLIVEIELYFAEYRSGNG